MTKRLRKKTTCCVPGHGTRCEPSCEKDKYYNRKTEKSLMFKIELSLEFCIGR